MAIPAYFQELSPDIDRRAADRRALRLDVEGRTPAATDAQASIHDLSHTGALLETDAHLAVGESFQLELPHAGTVEAVIVWSSSRFYGCQFKQPIAAAALSAALLLSRPQAAQTSPSSSGLADEVHDLNDQVARMLKDLDRALKRLRDESDG
jgi:hypothetical protein